MVDCFSDGTRRRGEEVVVGGRRTKKSLGMQHELCRKLFLFDQRVKEE